MATQKHDTKPRAFADGIPVYCAYDEILPIGQLRPNPKNPNKHPQEQIEKLGKIIRGNGWRNAITISGIPLFSRIGPIIFPSPESCSIQRITPPLAITSRIIPTGLKE